MIAFLSALLGAAVGAVLLNRIARAWKGWSVWWATLFGGGLAFLIGWFELGTVGLRRSLSDSFEFGWAVFGAGAGATLLISLLIGLPLIALAARR